MIEILAFFFFRVWPAVNFSIVFFAHISHLLFVYLFISLSFLDLFFIYLYLRSLLILNSLRPYLRIHIHILIHIHIPKPTNQPSQINCVVCLAIMCIIITTNQISLSIYIANTIGDTNIAKTRTPAHRTASRPLAFDPAAAFLFFLPLLSLGCLAGASWGHEVTEHWKAVMLAGRGTGPDPPTEIESWSTQRKVRLLARPSLTQLLSFG